MDRFIQINIDGRDINAYVGQQLVDVARQNGIYIPTLCYFHNIYPPAASCRVCTVKINGRFEAGCTCKVSNGMQVEVDTEEIHDLRKANIEMLLAEGNHFCPSCTKSGNCELQRKGYENGIAVLPTVPTSLAAIKSSLQGLMHKIEKMPLEEIGHNLNGVLEGVNKLTNSGDMSDTLKNLNEASAQLKATLATADEVVAGFDESSAAYQDIRKTMNELSAAARSLRLMMDYLERHPDALIKGK